MNKLILLIALTVSLVFSSITEAQSSKITFQRAKVKIAHYERKQAPLGGYEIGHCWRLSRATITCRVTEFGVFIDANNVVDFTWYPLVSLRNNSVVIWSKDWLL